MTISRVCAGLVAAIGLVAVAGRILGLEAAGTWSGLDARMTDPTAIGSIALAAALWWSCEATTLRRSRAIALVVVAAAAGGLIARVVVVGVASTAAEDAARDIPAAGTLVVGACAAAAIHAISAEPVRAWAVSLFANIVFVTSIMVLAIMLADPREAESSSVIASTSIPTATVLIVLMVGLWFHPRLGSWPPRATRGFILASSTLVPISVTVASSWILDDVEVRAVETAALGTTLIVVGLTVGVLAIRQARAETDRARAQAARTAAIVRSAGDAVFSLDADRRVDVWNDAAAEMFGFVADRTITVKDLGERIDGDRFAALVDEAIDSGVDTAVDIRVRQFLDEPITASITVSPLLDHRHRLVGAMVIARDVTEVRRRSRRVLRQRRELQRSNDALERFAYAASHDLQEPLRTVHSFTEILARRYDELLDDEGRQMVAHTLEGTRRLQRLVDDLLRYARVRSIDEDVAPIDPRAPLDEALDLLGETIRERDARITVGALPTVCVQSVDLRQVWLNLVSNSLRFTPQARPTIEIGVANAADDDPEEWATFVVRDDGPGIPEDSLETIFAPLERLDRSGPSGSGMGLWLCRAIVGSYGGEIVAVSVASGAEFRFTLPRRPAVEAPDDT